MQSTRSSRLRRRRPPGRSFTAHDSPPPTRHSVQSGREGLGAWPRLRGYAITAVRGGIGSWSGRTVPGVLAALLAATGAWARQPAQRPPLCPAWALQPWVWDDRGSDRDFSPSEGNAHRSQAVLELVDGYRSRGIPVGAVILDSPWASNYNTFRFDPRRYPDADRLVKALHERGVRVVAWFTAAMNPASEPGEDETDYQQALKRRYLLLGSDGGGIPWWKGSGGLLDYHDRRAVRWWHGLMDRALDLGIDGWKVDKVEAFLPEEVEKRGTPEPAHVSAYRRAYFKDTYEYLLRRRPEGVVIQRPFYRNTVAYTPAGWVGDQPHSWVGLRSALRLVLGAARRGNSVVGSDIGGYSGGHHPNKTLYLRWAEFGALCPLMETGGEGERRPWMIDDETVAIFRRFALLHAELAPYLYTQMVEAHRTGEPILRAENHCQSEYRLGPDLLVCPMLRAGATRDVRLPAGDWIDFWDETRVYHGPVLLSAYPAPLDRMPLFIRQGALLPLSVSTGLLGHGDADAADSLTLAAYPGGGSGSGPSCLYHYETGPRTYASAPLQVTVAGREVVLSVPPLPQAVRARVRLATRPERVLAPEPLPEIADSAAFRASSLGWHWEEGLLWVKLPRLG
jgi:alpha-glucosidase (family GH31 glycosyl hydrolase)